MMESSNGFVVDDRENGIFRIRRRVFIDPEVMEREKEKVFNRCWLYTGHECEIPNPGDFQARRVAGRPIVMVRGNDGAVRVLLNTCTHRGAMVCRERRGNAKTFQCFYHAWTFDNEGKLVGVPGEDAYGPGFKRDELALKCPPLVESYRGFVFINFDRNAQDLKSYLADSKEYLDIIADHGEPEGLEPVPGKHEYCMHANWKLLVENSMDGYHLAATHHRFVSQLLPDIGIKPEERRTAPGLPPRGLVRRLGNGHAVMVSPSFRPVDEFQLKQWQERYGVERTHRMVYHNHNLLIFPNLIFVDQFRTVRSFYPAAPNLVEVTAWALMPKGDTREIRRERLVNYLSFQGPGGFATPDDCEALECCQRGFANGEVEWSDLSRGMMQDQYGATDEFQMRTFWRRWNELMTDQN